MPPASLQDLIYEAAFLPEVWPLALEEMARRTASVGAVMQILPPGGARPAWQASPAVAASFAGYAASGDWSATHDCVDRWRRRGASFSRDVDVYTPDEIATDPSRVMLKRIGLGWQSGAIFAIPTQEIICISLERAHDKGAHPLSTVERMNRRLPDLARASLIAARLEAEVARAQLDILDRLGLAAAVLRPDGRTLAVNRAMEARTDVLVPRGFGKVGLTEAAGQARFQAALDRVGETGEPSSLPVRGGADRPPAVLHVLPLRRGARDLFTGGHVVVVLSRLAVTMLVPEVETLCGLFDLTPAEARLAARLAGGTSLIRAAEASGITVKTARSYLERIFQKTATGQQSELVALLKSAPTLTRESHPSNDG